MYSLVTEKSVYVFDPMESYYLLTCIKEVYGLDGNTPLPNVFECNFNMAEAVRAEAVRADLMCCDGHDCPRAERTRKLYESLIQAMNEKILVLAGIVYTKDFDYYKRIAVLVNEGMDLDDIKWLLTGGYLII